MKFLFTLLGALSLAYATELPQLDMRNYYNERSRPAFVEELSKAFHEHGAAIITHMGIRKDVSRRAYKALEAFFALDEAVKMRYNGAAVSYQRGYVPMRAEQAKGADFSDVKELYHFGKDHNVYPKEVPMQDIVDSYYRELEHYMMVLQEAIAMGIGMPKNFFAPMVAEGNSMLRFLHYPPHQGVWTRPRLNF